MKSHWLTGKEGYQFQVNLDVCMFIPKKVCKAYIYQMSCFLFTKTESIVSSIAKEVSPWKFRALFALLKNTGSRPTQAYTCHRYLPMNN